MKKKYDLIVLLQSYPNLIHAINYIFDNKEKKILILINGDLNIYKFLIKLFDQANIEVKIYGNNIFITSGILSRLLPLYVVYLNKVIPKLYCDELLLTFGNWCNVGALFVDKINSNNVTNLIAYEEKKYLIKSSETDKLPLFIKIINYYTKNLVERKKYFYEEKGNLKFIKRDSYGLVKQENINKTIHAKRERNYDEIKKYINFIDEPFILYIEKNLIKSKAISYINFIKLNISIFRMSKKNKIPIYIKFKPRDIFFLRKHFYKLLGFKILASHFPAQLYAIQNNCKFIIGFSSSSMAENYNKKVYSFGSIKNLFKQNVYGNINSLKERSYGNKSCIFLKSILDLENLS